jgi:uncharacterized repeat protein (TIGR01451 family)
MAALPALAQASRLSSAYGEFIHLRLVPLLGNLPAVTSGPQPTIAGNGPAAYDRYTEIANLNVTTPLTGNLLTAAIVGVHAAGGAGPSDSVTADATITNPSLRLVGALPLLTLTSNEIGSTATVGDLCSNAQNASGASDLVNARLGGILGNIPIPLSPAPNTVLLNQLGIKVTLNEQILVVSGPTTTLTVNAIHIQFAGAVTALGLLSGDVILAQSKAQSECDHQGLDLVLAKTAPSSVAVGSYFDYTLTVRNEGVETASAVSVTDALPPQVVLQGYSASQGSCSEPGALICDLGDIAAGGSATVVITVYAPASGTVVNTASAATASPELYLANNLASATVTVRPPLPI